METIMTSATTPKEIDYVRVATIRSSILLFKAGMRPNAQWTATKVKAAVEDICGRKFKRNDWDGMRDALRKVLDDRLAQLSAPVDTAGN
jgi:hypothetical protein